jgi:hypothetical protein
VDIVVDDIAAAATIDNAINFTAASNQDKPAAVNGTGGQSCPPALSRRENHQTAIRDRAL